VSEDATYMWRLRAALQANALGVPLELVGEAAGILTTVFGGEWLDEKCRRIDRGTVFPLRQHPLGSALRIGGESQVVEVLELAAYLKSLTAVSGLEVVTDLLRVQYRSAFLQFAIAHRVLGIGGTELMLEPQAQKGRHGDLRFRFDNEVVMVECYRPTVVGRPEHHVSRLMNDVLKLFPLDGAPVAVAVHLQTGIDHAARKTIVRTVERLWRRMQADPEHDPVLERIDVAVISVAPTVVAPPGADSILALHPDFPPLPNRASQFSRVGIATRDTLKVVDPTLRVPTGSCIAVWEKKFQHYVDADTTRLGLERLLRKARRKMAQTRGSDPARRLIVADSWVTDELHHVDADMDQMVREQLLSQHTGSAALLLTRRHWSSEEKRYRYSHHPFTQNGDKLFLDFGHRIIEWEREYLVP
jgi:hypothetical protein